MKGILLLFIALNLFADVALVSIRDLKYKEVVDFADLQEVNFNKRIYCNKFDKLKLLEDEYIAKRYILKNSPICDKDLEVSPNHRIKFDFGNIVIERSGQFMGETEKYIRVKTPDGSIEKIDKNGM
jgi:hypothetical protein